MAKSLTALCSTRVNVRLQWSVPEGGDTRRSCGGFDRNEMSPAQARLGKKQKCRECREPDTRGARWSAKGGQPFARYHVSGHGPNSRFRAPAVIGFHRAALDQGERAHADSELMLTARGRDKGPALKRCLGTAVLTADRIDYWIRRRMVERGPGAPREVAPGSAENTNARAGAPARFGALFRPPTAGAAPYACL